MGQIWSAHEALSNWKKNKCNIYISSILVRNKDIPKVEECFGMLDYKWLLDMTKYRNCVYTDPVVYKYVSGNNLSMQKRYAEINYLMCLYYAKGIAIRRRMRGTKGRWHYAMGEGKRARYYFLRSNINLKTILYYITSYVPFMMKYVCTKFRVMG